LLSPRLASTALIAAVMSSGDLGHDRYRAYANNPDNEFLSTKLSTLG